MKKKHFIYCLTTFCLFSACGGDSSTSPNTNNSEISKTSSSSITYQPNSSATENKEQKNFSSSSTAINSSSAQFISSSTVAAKGFPSNYNPDTGLLTDERDGEIYTTAKIGEQIWMGQNLRYLPADLVDDCEMRWIDQREKPDSLATYGRTYSWTEATRISCNYLTKKITFGNEEYPLPFQGICPKGWHIPDLNEWKKLIESTNNHLYKLLSTNWVCRNYAGTDEYGFNVLSPANGTHVEYIILDNTGSKSKTMVFNDLTGSTIQMETINSNKTAEGIYLRCLMD